MPSTNVARETCEDIFERLEIDFGNNNESRLTAGQISQAFVDLDCIGLIRISKQNAITFVDVHADFQKRAFASIAPFRNQFTIKLWHAITVALYSKEVSKIEPHTIKEVWLISDRIPDLSAKFQYLSIPLFIDDTILSVNSYSRFMFIKNITELAIEHGSSNFASLTFDANN